ncbi:recombinase-like helix-turn-helix domain-containing protein [Variovorax sp. KK3]|uniref:recombinase-like helix-turn-helix domain-containing protein n=1 Tax=Variovorax sp. KK3 TaxID=1855728 RepID=UPI00097C53C3|nr:recombinase-like helix-turn-helix domain-containing protein [Variovorax sp. KK3]
MQQDRYLQPHQARQRPATTYEDLLGDAIERAFADGVQDLATLVERLNDSGLSAPSGRAWTEDNYREEMGKLAQAN